MTEKMNHNNGPKLNDQMLIRREKLEKIRALGVEPYGQKFDYDHHASDIRKEAEELEKNETHVRLAGRIMIRRGQGKTAFCVLRDQSGDIQLYFRKDELPENEWALFKLVDLGDILGVEGVVFTTHTGELTVRVLHFTICPSRFVHCRKNGMASPIRNSAIARDTLTSWSIRKSKILSSSVQL